MYLYWLLAPFLKILRLTRPPLRSKAAAGANNGFVLSKALFPEVPLGAYGCGAKAGDFQKARRDFWKRFSIGEVPLQTKLKK